MGKTDWNYDYENGAVWKRPRFQELNILNLEYGQYEGDGEYDIPMLLPVHLEDLADIPIQGFNFAKTEKPEKRKTLGCHFYLHDNQFERVWNFPERYVELLKQFRFTLTPDFSPYSDMPKALQIFNVYRNRWCGRYWQEKGLNVIPTVTWSDADSLDVCLYGVPKHSTIAISTMGEGRFGNFASLRENWSYVMNRLEPDTVLLYGKDLSEELINPYGNVVPKKLISSRVAN